MSRFFNFFRTTIFPGGDNQSRTSRFDGERFVLGRNDTTTVDGSPVLTFADDRVRFTNEGSANTTGDTSTIAIDGDKGRVFNARHAEINAEGTGISITGRHAEILNAGTIAGDVNGVNFVNGGNSSGRLVNVGTVSSDSRAVNIGGDGIRIVNYGDIVGTGDQRNGTIYSDATAENYRIDNKRGGTIDAGEGNNGAGIALQTGNYTGDTVRARIDNDGTIAGRGQAAADTGLAGDGIRIFAGADDVTFRGDINNDGTITSESNQGATAAIRIANGVNFVGEIDNDRGAVIAGANNGVYFGEGEHRARIDNDGTISSDSRAVNIDGTGVRLDNDGDILGTGDQRNGTVYADATADNYEIDNGRRGTIDAGEGNDGAGIALQTGSFTGDVVRAEIENDGLIAGRGQAAANLGTAGDGIRIFAGADDVTFRGDINNDGKITSESEQGATAAIRIANGVNFVGEIDNDRGAVIAGANNGVYFGEGEHHARIDNDGTISSDSRAVNIDGTGVVLDNDGDILGTGDQRNGTVYADGTADNYVIDNGRRGNIDAGEGNNGAGVALQTGDFTGDVVNARIINRGDIDGRGQGAADSGLAGDGVRIFTSEGEATFRGDVFNSGDITSESTQGATAGFRVSDGVGFDGTITNTRTGDIVGAQNGLYFGNGAHNVTVRNFGEIESGSRAVNIDGTGVTLINDRDIEGTGDQRNGTVYADSTADNYAIINNRRGDIDAGRGNDGSGVSLQTGDVDGDTVTASVTNHGDIVGRGDAAVGNTVGDGVRIFSNQDDVTFTGDITNSGRIIASKDSSEAVGISIEDGVTLDGQIVNSGFISATETAIDATEAGGGVNVVNTGRIDGDVNLSDGNDVFNGSYGRVNGTIDGGAGDDVISSGRNDDVLVGGLGNDTLDGGSGNDTASYADADVPVDVDLAAGTATRETGFSISFEEVPVVPLTLNPDGSGNFVTEALNGNFYFNVHTNGFNGGEIRGQLDTVIDNTVNGTGTIIISGVLDASQEPGPTSDSEATGTGTVTIDVVGGVAVDYSLDLDITGLATSDLLPVAGVSSIHLHNAPRGVNGPVTLDAVQDAGGQVNGDVAPASVFTETQVPGFSVEVVDQPLASLTTAQSPAELVEEAANNNLYFNIHTNSFNGGEIRGQLLVLSDETDGDSGVRTITLNAALDSSQEPGPTSDSEATGIGVVTIVVDGADVTYSSSLSVTGIATTDLLPVAGVSSIHIHNAPEGENGAVITDVVQDAGGDVNGNAPGGSVFDAGVDPVLNVEVADQPLASLTTAQSPQDLVTEALNDNLYFNVHTNDFPGGEIRGQLQVVSDTTVDGVQTISLRAALDSSQEPGPTSDSDATGVGLVTITVDGDAVTYSSSLTLNGIEQSDLLPVAGVSAIHIHNAPAGVNGPVIADVVQDAGGDINGVIADGVGDTGDGNVFVEVAETDTLISIENVIGSDDGDSIAGDGGKNVLSGADGDDVLTGRGGNDTLLGGDGNDILAGGGGTDIIDGGAGIDTNSFSDIGSDVTVQLNADGTGTAQYQGGGGTINESFVNIENIEGSANNDTIIATGGAANAIDGGAGDDFIAGGGGTDSLDGGDGNDTNSFQGIGADVVADLGSGQASYQLANGNTIFETFSNFENLDGSSNDDILSGDGGANTLTGNDGNDELSGRGGNDILDGGDGNDILRGGGGNDQLDGGDGIDTADFTDIGVGVEIDLANGNAEYVVGGNVVVDTIKNVENVTGSANDDTISGDDGDNLLAGGAGADTINGGDGNDVLRGDALGSGEAITVTVTNTLGEGGTFVTPVWFGFHNGANFDLFDAGEAASLGLERLAEDGITTAIAAEFNAQVGENGVDATLIGPDGVPGPIDPGETTSFSLNVDFANVGQGFFTWATMIIPSNDAFLAVPDDALADPIFDADGNFLGPITIQRFGSDVLDAGTEVNNEEGAAFLNQTAIDQGIAEGGTVGSHPGFNGSVGNPDGAPVNILGGTTAPGAVIDPIEGDFTADNDQLLEIVIDRVAGSDDILDGGAGDDIIEGGGGNDTLTGGSGDDTFVFLRSSLADADTVTDFENGLDQFDVSDFGFTSVSDFTVAQVGADTLITLDANNSVTLSNTDANQIDDQDFLFG